jgi:hypothetical protein
MRKILPKAETLSKRFFWRVLLAVGVFSFLIYGVSFFVSEPKVETVTTSATGFAPNNQPTQNVKYKTSKRKN